MDLIGATVFGSETSAKPLTERIGVFGGAFDPPHHGHLALARAALEQLALDSLHIIPTGQAWHKTRTLSAPEHRLAMTQLAFGNLPRVEVDEREMRRTGPTFTIDTLQALLVENSQAQLYLLMGEDQFAAFRQWHRWQDILEIAIICIAARAQSTLTPIKFDAFPGLEDRFFALQLPQMPVSATQIRQLMASGAIGASELNQLVSEPVGRYISLHQLYSLR